MPAGELADPERCAEVVQDQRRAGHDAGQGQEVLVLEVVVPRVVGEAPLAQPGHPALERGIEVEPRRRSPGDGQHGAVRGSRPRMADAAEQALAGLVMGVEHLVQVIVVAQVGVGDDAADQPVGVAERLAGDEPGLPEWRPVVRVVAVVRGMALDEHGADHTVTATDGIGVQLLQPVGERATRRPEVVVRVDDAPAGVDDLLIDEVEPLLGHRFGHARCLASAKHLSRRGPAPRHAAAGTAPAARRRCGRG